MDIYELAKQMRELAETAKEEEREEISVTFGPDDVKSISGWKRASARREITLGDELKKRGWGCRNQDGSFTVFSGDGWKAISFSDALRAAEKL